MSSMLRQAGAPSPRLHVEYRQAPLDSVLADARTLAVVGFGRRAPDGHADPRYFNVNLEPLSSPAPFEVWRVDGDVERGRHGDIAWSRSEGLAFGCLTMEESRLGGIRSAAEAAYARLLDFLDGSAHPAVLRTWNYVDAIVEGDGDLERYREFCVGRARGIGGRLAAFPAATAIGLRDGRRTLRMYWLAGRLAGTPIENPRQVAAWRYPRQYGPQPPTFSRATLPAEASLPLLLSGTASVVGHASLHADSVALQIEETFRNFASLLEAAHTQRPRMPMRFSEKSLLKVYLREASDADAVRDALAHHLPADVPRLVLLADICRPELRIEIDGFHAGGGPL